jgi:hypothetical protein
MEPVPAYGLQPLTRKSTVKKDFGPHYQRRSRSEIRGFPGISLALPDEAQRIASTHSQSTSGAVDSDAVDIRTQDASGCEHPSNAASDSKLSREEQGLARGFRVVLVPQR